MMMLHLSSSLGGAHLDTTKSLIALSYLSTLAMTSSIVLMIFGFLTCCPKTTVFEAGWDVTGLVQGSNPLIFGTSPEVTWPSPDRQPLRNDQISYEMR